MVGVGAHKLAAQQPRHWGPTHKQLLLCTRANVVVRRSVWRTQAAADMKLVSGQELDEDFTGLADGEGYMSVAGFGSLLSERSARTTFPSLVNFRVAKVRDYRRVFAHCADIFYQRGIARADTGEVSSLSCEPCPGQSIVVAVFEVKVEDGFVQAFIEREHEFRFVAVEPLGLDDEPIGRMAVLCARFSDEEYKARRCPPDEFQRRWGAHGIDRIWRDDILPCRVYLRHCVLAAKSLGPAALESFLDNTFLADRKITIRQHLQRNPSIMEERPPPELEGRYSG